MSERDCPDDMAVEWEHKQERIRMTRMTAHPDCRDPAHPGCSKCRDDLPVEPTFEDAYAEGREDQRADDVKAIEALITAIRLGLA